MKLNHLDLQTSDVQALASLFVDCFDLERRSNDRSPKIAILSDGELTLVLQHDPAPVYPEGFHLGFIHDSVAPVIAHRVRLLAANVAVGDIDVNNRGTRFYLRAHGLLIEVSTPARL